MKSRRGITPLNCMDKALFALDSKIQPMVMHFVLTVAGRVDSARLRSALEAALARYPALRSTIRLGLLGAVREVHDLDSHEPLTVIELTGTDSGNGATRQREISQWMNRPLDPTKDVPCRVLVLRGSATESSLVFTFHHSATDGIGSLRFMAEVIGRYNGVEDEPRTSDRASGGESDGLLALARACRSRTTHFNLRMAVSLCHRFTIAPLSHNERMCRISSRPSPAIDYCEGSLSPHELGLIRARSKAAGATVNDLFLAAGFRAMEQWNSVHGKRSQKITIMVPVDISHGTSLLPVGNRVSFISVPTSRGEREDLERLLRTVTQKTSRMLRSGTAFSIVYAVHFFCRFPPRIHKAVAWFLLATRIYLDSILITNLGVILPGGSTPVEWVNMGDAKITEVVGIPPVVSPMGVSLCVGTYNGQLHVALVYKTSHFSRSEAQLFLNLYLHEMRSYQRTAEGMLAPQVTERVTRETAQAR